MTKIFISYRRDDSVDIAGRIYDRLVQAFGKDNIFKDVDSIPFGVNFKKHLADAVQQCAVELVVIGRAWLDIADEHGNRRLDDPRDFVRIEIEAALTRDIPVIPLLVGGASMPTEDRLPDSLGDLAYRNAATVGRDPYFHLDMDRVIESLKDWSIVTIPSQKSTELLPAPFAWMPIPAGQVTIEGTVHNVDPFFMAKYPVTNKQYRMFIEAGGYKDQRWWTEEEWVLLKPNKRPEHGFGYDSKWNNDHQPKVGVSWHDSMAFCRWLSHRTGEQVILPTEAQWQFAAQGIDGRIYPWGNLWDSNRCNNNVDDQGVGKTTRVGQYKGKAKGDSPFKVTDMAGNIWEWCLTNYFIEQARVDGTVNPNVLRGGSWADHYAEMFRCDRRGGAAPYTSDSHYGFRLARS